jgi:Aerobic-type carbon monoxide dehydrogenase, small subunit CoxS/CutS homologs
MIEFTLNGQPVVFHDDPNIPLLWAVRDDFKLKGSKFGCGAGLCGACTMHVDGKAVRTCVLPVANVAGKSVTTIEGLGNPSDMHPLQQAWVDHNVPQCGYCQSGQIMSAAALLAQNPAATADDVDNAMSGNLCRCGCYPRIKAAVLSLAEESA